MKNSKNPLKLMNNKKKNASNILSVFFLLVFKFINKILIKLLNTKGVGLPMASTILKFKNRKIFQIIDQRVYRILYGKPLKISSSLSERKINETIMIYYNYLDKLSNVSKALKVKFEDSDRVLYMLDRRVNSSIKIR